MFADSLRYFLTLTSFQPLYGKLSDIFGRKPCLLFAYSVFGLGCLLCGAARNLRELIAARAFAGECLFRQEQIGIRKADPSRHRRRRHDNVGFVLLLISLCCFLR